MRIRGPGWRQFGSGMEKSRIRDKHPGSATLTEGHRRSLPEEEDETVELDQHAHQGEPAQHHQDSTKKCTTTCTKQGYRLFYTRASSRQKPFDGITVNNKFRGREIDNQNRRFSVHTFYAPRFHQKMHYYLHQTGI